MRSTKREQMSVATYLEVLGVADVDALQTTVPVDKARSVIRRAYLQLALLHHPDRNGDAQKFDAVHVAWESLTAATKDWSLPLSEAVVTAPTTTVVRPRTTAAAWEEALAAGVPSLRVEIAKTSRSKCKVTGEPIEAGSIKIGQLDAISGSYSSWKALSAWKVPNSIHTNLFGDQEPLPGLLALDDLLYDTVCSAVLHRFFGVARWRAGGEIAQLVVARFAGRNSAELA